VRSKYDDPLSEFSILSSRARWFLAPISGAGLWGVSYSAFGSPASAPCSKGVVASPWRAASASRSHQVSFCSCRDAGLHHSCLQGDDALTFYPNVCLKASGRSSSRPALWASDVGCPSAGSPFASPDAALLVSLLPALIHGQRRRPAFGLVLLVGEEAGERGRAATSCFTAPGGVAAHRSLRSAPARPHRRGCLRGLADGPLAPRCAYAWPLARSWDGGRLDKIAARSAAPRFSNASFAPCVPPMYYLLAWRMAVERTCSAARTEARRSR